jgi:hypothetical protein
VSRLLARVFAALVVCAAIPVPAVAQSAVDMALLFYSNGGVYCFRVVPFGVNLSEETEWTVMMLTSTSNKHNTFRIRSVDPGETGLKGSGLQTAGRFANDVWKFDGTRAEFFERFSEGIRSGKLRVRVVNAAPPNLAGLPERERAEQYLKFADRGTKVSFDEAPDLNVEEFQRYAEHFPD